MSEGGDLAAFERIRQYLQETRGFDFTAYKRASVLRRTLKRMQAVGVNGLDEYLDYLQVHPNEFGSLFNTILINVTSFFRDTEVWDTLRTTVARELLGPDLNQPVRVWSAGCASGEEAYSVAMMLGEAMGIEAFCDRVKIYATDVDEEALAHARQAIYPARQVEKEVPPGLAEKYFDRAGDGYVFKREMRRSVIFGRHDLIQDAPISRIDLLLCRNTLMYFNSEAQARIMSRFYYSLFPDGLLVLGRAEMLFSHPTSFQPVDLKRRIFSAVPKANHRERLLMLAQSSREDVMASQHPDHGRLREQAFDTSSDPQIVLDPSGALVATNAAARKQFNIVASAIGQPFRDVELSYRPAELRVAIERAREARHETTLNGVRWDQNGVVRFVDIVAAPLFDDDRAPLGMRITFVDVTPIKSLQDQLVTRSRSSRLPTRSCSPPTRSSKPPTRSCSRPSRSSRPPTRSCSRRTRSSRR